MASDIGKIETKAQFLAMKDVLMLCNQNKPFHSSMSTRNREVSSTGKLQDGFTVLLMTETKFGIILTLENNTNPFDLLGNCRSCQENWMNRGHEKTRLCLEHENKITFYLLFHCS